MERRKLSAARKPLRLRSLNDLDGRTTAAKAAFELRNSIANDLGGNDALSTMQQAIVENVAVLGAVLNDMAAKYLAGEGGDMALYATLANSQRRLLADLGLQRRSNDVVPSLKDYVRRRA